MIQKYFSIAVIPFCFAFLYEREFEKCHFNFLYQRHVSSPYFSIDLCQINKEPYYVPHAIPEAGVMAVKKTGKDSKS